MSHRQNQRALHPVLTPQLAIFCHKEQGESIRADMAAGTVIIRCINKSAHMYSLLNFLHNIKGFLVSIRMGYADDLLLRLCDIIA